MASCLFTYKTYYKTNGTYAIVFFLITIKYDQICYTDYVYGTRVKKNVAPGFLHECRVPTHIYLI